MKKIYKYVLDVKDHQELYLPRDSKILSVNEQFDNIVLYALVNTETLAKDRYSIIIHGTGHFADDVDDCIFLGTVKMHGGQLMFHVFYKQL